MSSRLRWPGLRNAARYLWEGAQPKSNPPKAKYHETLTPTLRQDYTGMHKYYRWFRQDSRTRKCIITNAYFSTMTAGFETVLEPTEKQENPEEFVKDYEYVKEGIDAYNRRVNMDLSLFVAQVKRSIYGKAGFEIVLRSDGTPSWLLSLQSTKLKPKINSAWELESYSYEGRENLYKPEEVLYLLNLPLESDREGLSDIEPIVDACEARHTLIGTDFKKIAEKLWAPYVLLEADTRGMSPTLADQTIDDISKIAQAGRSMAINESITPHIVAIKPDIGGLVQLKDDLDEEIIGHFGTPPFLLGKPIENRAIAYAEFEAYVQGPIAWIQRYLKREIEAQWYDPWALKIFELEGKKRFEEGELPPVLVKHKWNTIRTIDVYEMAKAAAQLYGPSGLGVLGDRPKKVYEMMGWDPSELEEEEE